MMQEVLAAIGAGSRIAVVNGTEGSWIEADVSMMERVVQNLVVNALAYTPSGGFIGIRLDREGSELLFTIVNEGPALAEELVGWINTPDATRPAAAAIGLAIVRKVLLLHGFGFSVAVGQGRNVFVVRMGVYRA